MVNMSDISKDEEIQEPGVGNESLFDCNIVVVDKIDLDTVGCAFILGIRQKDMVKVLNGRTISKEILENPFVICIEIGGSGQVGLNNFDHHEENGPTDSATQQVFSLFGNKSDRMMTCLVEYIDTLDTRGKKELEKHQKSYFPSLFDIFSGMLLIEKNPVNQLHKGINILKHLVDSNQNPFGPIHGFQLYSAAAKENINRMKKAAAEAKWMKTKKGRPLVYLETHCRGPINFLYEQGAEIVIAYSPAFGNSSSPKFTIASQEIKLITLSKELEKLEKGWGCQANGIIIGSPKMGSHLTVDQVVTAAKHCL